MALSYDRGVRRFDSRTRDHKFSWEVYLKVAHGRERSSRPFWMKSWESLLTQLHVVISHPFSVYWTILRGLNIEYTELAKTAELAEQFKLADQAKRAQQAEKTELAEQVELGWSRWWDWGSWTGWVGWSSGWGGQESWTGWGCWTSWVCRRGWESWTSHLGVLSIQWAGRVELFLII